MNSVILIGHIGENPNFTYKNKKLCCTFNLNVKRDLRKYPSNRHQTIDSIPIVLWNKEARFARRYFITDDYNQHLVMITGEIHIQFYMENHQLHWTPKVVGDDIVIVG